CATHIDNARAIGRDSEITVEAVGHERCRAGRNDREVADDFRYPWRPEMSRTEADTRRKDQRGSSHNRQLPRLGAKDCVDRGPGIGAIIGFGTYFALQAPSLQLMLEGVNRSERVVL